MGVILIPTPLLSLSRFPLLISDLLDLEAIQTRWKEGLSNLRGWIRAWKFYITSRLGPFLVWLNIFHYPVILARCDCLVLFQVFIGVIAKLKVIFLKWRRWIMPHCAIADRIHDVWLLLNIHHDDSADRWVPMFRLCSPVLVLWANRRYGLSRTEDASLGVKLICLDWSDIVLGVVVNFVVDNLILGFGHRLQGRS